MTHGIGHRITAEAAVTFHTQETPLPTEADSSIRKPVPFVPCPVVPFYMALSRQPFASAHAKTNSKYDTSTTPARLHISSPHPPSKTPPGRLRRATRPPPGIHNGRKTRPTDVPQHRLVQQGRSQAWARMPPLEDNKNAYKTFKQLTPPPPFHAALVLYDESRAAQVSLFSSACT